MSFILVRYFWKKNGAAFEWTKLRKNGNSGTITTIDPGLYQCFAENENGIATSNKVFYHKIFLNSFNNSIQTIRAVKNRPLVLKCDVPERWPKLKVQWKHKNRFGQLIIDPRMTMGPDANLYISTVVQSDHLSQYICIVSLGTKSVTRIVNLIVGLNNDITVTIPILQYAKPNVVAVANKTFEIFCIYGGMPTPITTWKRNGKPINNSNYGRIRLGANRRSLIFENVTLNDGGSYNCEAANLFGTATRTINLNVNVAPRFKVKPIDGGASVGESFELRCETEGKPIAKKQWLFNGKPIKQSIIRNLVNGNSFIINNVTLKDQGLYGCLAENSVGHIYHEVSLKVLSNPLGITER